MRNCNICPKCKIEKEITLEFYEFRKETGKFRLNICKKCKSNEVIKYYNLNKHKLNIKYDPIYNKNYKIKNKENISKKNKEYRLRKGLTTGKGQTIPEKTIENWLIDNKIEFFKEKSFANCKNKSVLNFDFWLPKLNILIEYDGEHHFKPIWNNFEQVKYNDLIKNEYCKNEKIKLVRISYKENILERLNSNICL